MTVGELEKICAGIKNKYMDVAIKQNNDDFSTSLAESAKVTKVSFSEEPGSKVLAKDNVLLLTDEI